LTSGRFLFIVKNILIYLKSLMFNLKIMKNNQILIHDTSGVYLNLFKKNAIENKNIHFSNSIYDFINIDFNKFSLIIHFINTKDDLLDFAYINNIPNVTKYIGAANVNVKSTLQCFSVNLFEINAPKKEIISQIKSIIKFETENNDEISKHEIL
jgi:hypothetical protein